MVIIRFMKRFLRGLQALFRLDRWIGLAILVALLGLRAADPEILELIRLKTFDYYQKFSPREIPPLERQFVSIVDIDENSIQELGQWPWPRSLIAEMVETLFENGAAVIAFDMTFPEPDRLNPASVAETVVGLDEPLKAKLRTLPSNDALLAQAFERGRVVVGQAGFWEEKDEPWRPPLRTSLAFRGSKPHDWLADRPTMIRNIEVLEAAAAGQGIFSIDPEPDGIIRRVPTLHRYGDTLFSTLAVEMLRLATGRKTILVTSGDAGIESVKITPQLILPTDAHGRIWPYFSQRDKSKYIPARDVLSGVADPALINGKMILVGTSAVGLLDIRSVPTERIIPGVEVHAQLIETVIDRSYLKRPSYMNVIEMGGLAIVGLLLIFLVPVIGARWTLVLGGILFVGSAGLSWYAFAEHRLLVDAAYPIIGSFLLYMALTYMGYASEEAQKRQVRDAFSHYLSPAMVEKLADDPSRLKLGGETRNMSMLFCDVVGFTSVSEQLDAHGLTRLINKLLTPLTDVILRRSGTVDKYMGDCIMAFWNAPLDDDEHAANAIKSALEMNATMAPLNERLMQEAEAEGRKHIDLKIGIGVNSGDVVVGNMGSDQRFDYSILGDNVNLASRLEGQCRTYGVDLVVGENSRDLAPELAYLELDLIRVKGKAQAVRIFTVVGDEQEAASDRYKTLAAAHDQLLSDYRGQRWEACAEGVKTCRAAAEGYRVDRFYDLLEQRVDAFSKDPPAPDWDGVFVATSK